MNRIAIDIDEVLVPLVRPMAKWANLNMPSGRKYSYVYRDMFNITEAQSQEMVKGFYKSEEFILLQPTIGSHPILRLIRPGVDKIYAVTGRQECVRQETEDWLQFHFANIFDDVILTNSYTELEVPKVDICTSLNLDTIIDDNYGICESCESRGIASIHFGGSDGVLYPWCDEYSNTVLSWNELYNSYEDGDCSLRID